MEQLDGIIFSFDAFAERDGSAAVPFSLRVASPLYDDERGFFCYIACPYLREKPFRIFGVDEEQACELSISFIRNSLIGIGAVLVDQNGEQVTIPEIDHSPGPTQDKS